MPDEIPLNMNVPRKLGRRLTSQGYDCRHVDDIGMAQVSDLIIMKEARENREIIVTHDLDYGDLLAFSGETNPSVIIFRIRNTHVDNLFKQIVEAWGEIERPLTEGAVITFEDAALRIRKLPILEEEK
jgi:predicted nuclease of predicted toxin-antitoxin system